MNKSRFQSIRLERPTAYVDAPALAGVLFDEGEQARFKCRGLDANGLYMARQRRDENNPVRVMIKTLQDSGQLKNGLQEAFQGIFGDPDKATAAQTAYCIELIVLGVIDEGGKRILDYEDAAKLGEHYPAIFLELANTIQRLSGEASVQPGESRGLSGKRIESGEPSVSQNVAGASSSRPSPMSSHTGGLQTLN